jgi:hypothetical protein
MKLIVMYRAVWMGFLLVAASAATLAQSKYEAVFETYRRTLDVQALDEGVSEAHRKVTHFDEDVRYLASVLEPGGFDETAQEAARQELDAIAYSVIAYSGSASIQDYFRPAMEAFQKHMPEASADTESKWARSLVSLTAVVGLQPNPPMVGLIYRMLDGKNKMLGNIALLALARIKPLPPDANKILLTRGAGLDPKGRLEMWAFALDDPDVREAFLKYLDSENVEDQRLATLVLSQIQTPALPILGHLVQLRSRKDLDAQVAANLDRALAHKAPVQ